MKWDDPETVLYSKDVMTFAQKKGYFPKDGKAEDFSFVGAYGAGPPQLGRPTVWHCHWHWQLPGYYA